MKKKSLSKGQSRPVTSRPNALERLMEKSSKDSSQHGRFFKMLMTCELFLLIPPAEQGLKQDSSDEKAPKHWCAFEDARGKFTPVFTSQAAAKARLGNVPELQVLILKKMAADPLLRLLSHSKTPVRIIARGTVQVTLRPEALALLLADGLGARR